MTANQRRACELALRVLQDDTLGDRLDELDWTLLLLAASLNCSLLAPDKVASRVLADCMSGRGYFVGETAGEYSASTIPLAM